MPEQPDNYEPTEADLDMVGEELSGKPVDKGGAMANAQAIEERIAQLETERARLISNQAKLSSEAFAKHLAAYDSDLATARERLAYFRIQLDKLN